MSATDEIAALIDKVRREAFEAGYRKGAQDAVPQLIGWLQTIEWDPESFDPFSDVDMETETAKAAEQHQAETSEPSEPEAPQETEAAPETNERPDTEEPPPVERVYDAIVLLIEAGDKVTNTAIATRAGIPTLSVTEHLRWLEKAGRIVVTGRTSRRQITLPGGPPPDPKPAADKPRRRFIDMPGLNPEGVVGLSEDHEAVKKGRTLFPTTVVDPADSPRLLISGQNSRKIGDRVTKGPWKGMPIYTLTLEERASCPKDCHHWLTCYGNGMPFARRQKHGHEFEKTLDRELDDLNRQHRGGFVVRLHILGDFYSLDYVDLWGRWLKAFPNLHVFGYTAHQRGTSIGDAVHQLAKERWDRFAVRTSARAPLRMGASTLWETPEAPSTNMGIVCPMQLGRTDCCGTCGLCWHPNFKDKTVAFVAHGRTGRPPAEANVPEALPDTRDEKKKRKCLTCQKDFLSEGAHNRVCQACKGTVDWKAPGDLSTQWVPE